MSECNTIANHDSFYAHAAHLNDTKHSFMSISSIPEDF